MKRKLLVILLFVFLLSTLTACGVNFGNLEDTLISIPQKTGALGEFALTNPAQGQTVYDVPTFTWQESTNASHYTFEMCSTLDFSNVDNMGNTIDVYVKKTGVTDTTITPTATIRQKGQTYYWRVTAHNADGSKLCTGEVGSFYLGVPDVGQIEIPIDYADEWVRHEVGSYGAVSIDKSNFFGNNKNSLVITFAEEDTNRGNAESDGWLCFTHSVEQDFYGVDAFKFNFYYSGDDATVLIRVVDADNEYWQAQVQIAGNNKQTVILRFEDFELRTSGGTTIANQEFDYNYIRTVDFTFERTFGDGVAVISDLAAVKFADYEHLFIKKLDFSKYSTDDFVYNDAEGTTFTPEILDDGATLSLPFKGNNGYAFARLPINAFLEKGDAFRVTLNYTGSYKSTANVLIRLIEEDGDRWSYTHKASLCGENGTTLIIPFSAFASSEIAADGARQFSYIKQLQFGFSGGVYGSGTLTFSNIEVVTLAEEMNNLYQKEVGADGVIDNFEAYTTDVEIYYNWQASNTNKDEAMSLSNVGIFSFDNNAYGVFAYKSDMIAATYGINLTVPAGFTSLVFSAKDNSLLDERYSHLDSVPAKLTISLYNQTGVAYVYTIDALSSGWTTYNIPIAEFVSTIPTALTSEAISGIKFEMQYFYYDASGNASPIYTPKNEVFLDDIAFANGQTLSVEPANKYVVAEDGSSVAIVDDFNGYTTTQNAWSNGVLTTSYDNSNALAVAYEQNTAQTKILMQVDETVKASALALSLKGDGSTTVTITITFIHADKEVTVTKTLYNVGDWTKYTIGWDNFTASGNQGMTKNLVCDITSIQISATTTNGQTTTLLVDDVCFISGISGATNTQTAL